MGSEETGAAERPQRAIASDGVSARNFLALASGFWRGPVRRRAWFWSLTLAAAIIANVFANVAVNRWNGWFFDALEKRDAATAATAIMVFPVIVAVAAGLGVVILISRETLQARWREWLARDLVGRWLANRRFYRLGVTGLEPANPEYRIADDVRWATEPPVDFAIGLLHALITVVTFIGILWSIGGSLSVPAGGGAVVIPAYLVLAAILYGLAVSSLTMLVGRPLSRRVAEKNEAEAKLRFGLMRVRDHGEAIALTGGAEHERDGIGRIYDNLILRWLAMIRRRGHLTWITNSSGVLVPVLPLLLAAPKYLSGEMSLGGVIQVAAAFVHVQNSFNWILDNFMRIAEWVASARRVNELAEALERVEQPDAAPSGIALAPLSDPGSRLAVEGLTLADPEGRILLSEATFRLREGETLRILGELGLGQGALVHAIAGLWFSGSGRIERPAGVCILTAHPHFAPATSLRAFLEAPEDDDRVLRERLSRYGLSTLAGRLDEVADWDRKLASSDRMRLGFARAEGARAELFVLFEATQTVEPAAAHQLIERLRAARPAAGFLLVGRGPGFAEAAERLVRARIVGGVARLGPSEPASVHDPVSHMN